MVAVVEEAAAATQRQVHAPGEPAAQALHAAGEGLSAVSFDDEVEVVPEHGELAQSKARPLHARAECGENRVEQGVAAQVGHVTAHVQRDVNRAVPVQHRPGLVRDARLSGTFGFRPAFRRLPPQFMKPKATCGAACFRDLRAI